MDYTRHSGIVNMQRIQTNSVTLIGAGAIGSFTALTLTKMGITKLEVFDEDGVSEHNLPNQFYRIQDIGQFKVDALQDIVEDFSEQVITVRKEMYTNQQLNSTVIVATDSMSSRRLVWEQHLKQPQTSLYIEARMGGQFGLVYTISSKSKANVKFYENTLHSDKDSAQLPCTARSIIYNVLMLSSLISKAYASVMSDKPMPREMVFNMQDIHSSSFMVRQ